MDTKYHKTASILWISGSLLFVVSMIAFIVVYQPASGSYADKTKELLKGWPIISTIWRIETLAVILLGVSSWAFTLQRRTIFWIIIAFAHIIMTIMYAYMLGAYPLATSNYSEMPILFPMMNDTASWIFSLSNLLFLAGLAGIYYTDVLINRWLALFGFFISIIGALGMLALFLGMVTFAQAVAVGPLIGILYLLNAYYGFKLVSLPD
ncbi:MAG: hypothetical protein PVH63_12770 [Balneolaceae bacterium]|jgi:hypothetical protein